MVPWFVEHPEVAREIEAQSAKYIWGSLPAIIQPDNTLVICGWISSRVGRIRTDLKIRVEFPPDFKIRGQIPRVYDDQKIYESPDLDGHIVRNSRFCLSIPGNTAIDTPTFSIKGLVSYLWIFLAQQHIYQLDKFISKFTGIRAKWPGAEYSHGQKGMEEAADERMLDEMCICGSGRAFEDCCYEIYGKDQRESRLRPNIRKDKKPN